MSDDIDKAAYAAVRKTLQHHKLTDVGNAVVEADLVHAVLSNHNVADKVDWLKKVLQSGAQRPRQQQSSARQSRQQPASPSTTSSRS